MRPRRAPQTGGSGPVSRPAAHDSPFRLWKDRLIGADGRRYSPRASLLGLVDDRLGSSLPPFVRTESVARSISGGASPLGGRLLCRSFDSCPWRIYRHLGPRVKSPFARPPLGWAPPRSKPLNVDAQPRIIFGRALALPPPPFPAPPLLTLAACPPTGRREGDRPRIPSPVEKVPPPFGRPLGGPWEALGSGSRAPKPPMQMRCVPPAMRRFLALFVPHGTFSALRGRPRMSAPPARKRSPRFPDGMRCSKDSTGRWLDSLCTPRPFFRPCAGGRAPAGRQGRPEERAPQKVCAHDRAPGAHRRGAWAGSSCLGGWGGLSVPCIRGAALARLLPR